MTKEIRELAIERASADQIRDVAIEQGMRTLQQDGIDKVRMGHHLDPGSCASYGFRPGCRLGSERRREDDGRRWTSISQKSSSRRVELNASDLHLTVGAPPMVRVRGELQALDDYPR